MSEGQVNQDKSSGNWQDHVDDDEFPILDTLKSSAVFGAYTGSASLIVGSVVGILRSSHPVLYAGATGSLGFGAGTGYSACRQLLLSKTDYDPKTTPYVSALSGSLTGAATAAVLRGRANVAPAAVIWGLAGFIGQKSLDAYRSSSQEPSQTKQTSLWDSKWSPMSRITDDDYEILLRERLVKIDARVAIIDEDLAKLRSQDVADATKHP